MLAIGLLVLLHEGGHFFFAKLVGVRVDKFYLFFDPSIWKWDGSLFKWKPKNSDTQYGMGWLPLGGYCKIAGMIDESFDTEQMKQPEQPWEFRSKPAWQRLLVMSGGVLNNFILAIVLFCAILGIWGDNYIPNNSPVYVNELGEELGFRTGDRILRMDNYVPEDFLNLQADLARRQVQQVQVLRGTDTLTLYMDQSLMGAVVNTPGMFDIALPFVIDSVMYTSPNVGSGLARGDHIVAVAGVSAPYLQDAQKVLRAHPGEQLPVTVVRGADSLSMTLQVDSLGMLGVYPRNIAIEHRTYTVASCIPAGCNRQQNLPGARSVMVCWYVIRHFMPDRILPRTCHTTHTTSILPM